MGKPTYWDVEDVLPTQGSSTNSWRCFQNFRHFRVFGREVYLQFPVALAFWSCILSTSVLQPKLLLEEPWKDEEDEGGDEEEEDETDDSDDGDAFPRGFIQSQSVQTIKQQRLYQFKRYTQCLLSSQKNDQINICYPPFNAFSLIFFCEWLPLSPTPGGQGSVGAGSRSTPGIATHRRATFTRWRMSSEARALVCACGACSAFGTKFGHALLLSAPLQGWHICSLLKVAWVFLEGWKTTVFII